MPINIGWVFEPLSWLIHAFLTSRQKMSVEIDDGDGVGGETEDKWGPILFKVEYHQCRSERTFNTLRSW